MNKTISINLGSIFFHIDEVAFNKLKSYLDDIKLYLHQEESKDEIINDIETRIAEIFMNEREDAQQVISIEVVEKVIKIMGNPEDYRVDGDSNYDNHSTNHKTNRKLYRDQDAKVLGGISAGFGHYFKIDAIWLRILFVLLTIITSGSFILVYIACWLLIPPALTTSEKLAMQGEEINLSNIEKKVKENYNKFAQKVDDIDYEKYKAQTKNSAQKVGDGAVKAFNSLGRFIKKAIGLLLIFLAGAMLLSLTISLFSLGSISVFGDINYYDLGLGDLSLPLWVYGIILFISIAIPFFYLLILGLKLLVTNLRKLGRALNISLFTIWIFAVFSLILFAVKHSLKDTHKAELVEVRETNFSSKDTISIAMAENIRYNINSVKSYTNQLVFDKNNKEIAIGRLININLKATTDSVAKIRVEKSARSTSKVKAKDLANEVDYQIKLNTNQIKLDNYFKIPAAYVNHKTGVEVTLLLPDGIHINVDEHVFNFKNRFRTFNEIEAIKPNQLSRIDHRTSICISCPIQKKDTIQ